MKVSSILPSATALALAAFCFPGAVGAVPLVCKEAAATHATMDASEVSSCLAADVSHGKDDGLSVDVRHNEITIAVARVGSDKLDNWFVYFLNPLLSSGDWHFTKLIDRNGRLSHIKLYGRDLSKNVPEPGALALLGIGLLGVGLARRRKHS